MRNECSCERSWERARHPNLGKNPNTPTALASIRHSLRDVRDVVMDRYALVGLVAPVRNAAVINGDPIEHSRRVVG